MLNLTQVEIGYFAGLVDGEGHIGMVKDDCLNGDRKLRFRLRLTIATTSPLLVAWLIAKTAGAVSALPVRDPKHAQSWRISYSEGKGEELVRLIEPLLVIKRQHAQLYLRYREVNKFCKENRVAARVQIKSIRSLRDWFYVEFRRINARGPETVETNTPDVVAYEQAIMKIESELRGNVQRAIGDDAPPTNIVQ